MTDSNHPLTYKQERFCQEYVVWCEAKKAATVAGYSENSAHVTGCRLLQDPRIKARISKLTVEKSAERDVSEKAVTKMLQDSFDAATQAGQHGPAVRAAELLGKRHAMFTDRTETDQTGGKSGAEMAASFEGGGLAKAIIQHLGDHGARDDATLNALVARYNRAQEARKPKLALVPPAV